MTSWLSTRGFIAGALIGVMAAWDALTVRQNIVEGSVTVIASALFWGWILTKFAGRWFAVPKKPGEDS